MSKRTNLKARLVKTLILLTMGCTSFASQVIYVDDDATGTDDGTSWENAFIYLQDAIADAETSEKPVEIRVAHGTYTPDKGADRTPGDREATFHLSNGVTLKGSYAGITGPDPNLRDIESYQTILSGELRSNDIEVNDPCELLIEPTRAENSYHVVTCVIEETAILDGFTITAGNANVTPLRPYSIDGFIYDSYGNFSSNNYIFEVNLTTDKGGGMYNISNLSVYNCTFSKNSALSYGGGVYNKGLPEIKKEITFNNCYFKGNCANYGGGMYNSYASYTDIKMTFCVFEGNYAQLLRIGGKGGGICNFDNSPMLTNCTFVGNHAETSCGGIMNYYESNSILKNCIFWDNTNLWDDEYSQIGGSSSVSYSDIQGGWEGEGNINIDPLFANPDYWANGEDPNIAAEPNDPNAVWIDGNYHLKSQAGRWDPASETWIQDDVTSPCADAGDPNSPIGHEPFPNGGIINMGAYGGTAQASKSYFGKPVCETIIAGDINGDCKVDFDDLMILIAHWLEDHNPKY